MDIYKESDLYNRSTGIKEGTHQIYDYTICDYCGERLPDKMFDDEYLTTTFYKIYETAMIEPWFDQIDITKDIDRYDFFNNNDKFHLTVDQETSNVYAGSSPVRTAWRRSPTGMRRTA